MKTKRIMGLILLLALFVVPSAFALTMADLIQPGAFLIIDDKKFYNFAYTAAGGAPTAGQITVVPLPTVGNPGLRFVAAWTVGAGGLIDSNISYYVQVLPGGAPIIDIGALMAGAGFTGTGRVNLAENVFDNTIPPPNNIANIFLYHDSGGSLLNLEYDLANGVTDIFVVKDIILAGGETGRAALSFVENTYSEKIPEPISLILLGSGLAGAGLYRRLRKPRG